MMLANELRTFFQDWQYTRQIDFIKSGEKSKAQFCSYYKKKKKNVTRSSPVQRVTTS